MSTVPRPRNPGLYASKCPSPRSPNNFHKGNIPSVLQPTGLAADGLLPLQSDLALHLRLLTKLSFGKSGRVDRSYTEKKQPLMTNTILNVNSQRLESNAH